MSLLFSCQAIFKSYPGMPSIFEDFHLNIFSGDQIGIVGLNGSGKSTLLKIIAGLEKPDEGIVSPKKDLSIGYVSQSCEFPDLPPKEILEQALKEDFPYYEKERLAKIKLNQLGFTGKEPSANLLSGGWKKRLQIAVELISSPDLLLLDEPTNHLDLEGILWLENFLAKQSQTYLVVSHDRCFLQHMTNKIVEINKAYPKGLFISKGPYTEFLNRKEIFLKGQLQQEQGIATKVRREQAWLKAGVKARSTKAQSRIDEAEKILEAYNDIKARNKITKTKINFISTERKTAKLLVAKNLSKTIETKLLFRNLDLTLSPGTRIALIGPNGSGKTTLLRMLAEEILPDQGTIKRAENLKTVYFDQHRSQLPLDMSLKRALSPRGDFVSFQGKDIHVNGWCKRFLFSPDILEIPIGKLSGGERARISIAHLMLQPADILFLDEPTNDLDIPTLETLEESLLEFSGAIVLITHDRLMTDRICNSVLSLANPEKIEIFADYSQWKISSQNETRQKKDTSASPLPKKQSKSKVLYQEKKELNATERKIAKLEKEVCSLNALLQDKEVLDKPERLSEICTAIELLETEIEKLYLRWEELENKRNLH